MQVAFIWEAQQSAKLYQNRRAWPGSSQLLLLARDPHHCGERHTNQGQRSRLGNLARHARDASICHCGTRGGNEYCNNTRHILTD